MANHLRITATGWETYTGDFGGVAFVNGLSVDVLSRRQIDHISALVRCDLSDDKGALMGQSGISARLVGGVNIGDAPSSLRKATQDELDADRRQRLTNIGKAPTKIYTKEELEAIAAKEGLSGLRKIGDAWSVRDRAIGKLVTLILNAQNVFVASQKARADLVEVSRAQATAEAFAKNAAREADIDARAKLAGTTAGTSNAIGANGENVTMPPPAAPVVAPVVEPVAAASPTIAPTVTTTDTVQLTQADMAAATPTVDTAISDALALVAEQAAVALHATPEQILAAAETIKADQKA